MYPEAGLKCLAGHDLPQFRSGVAMSLELSNAKEGFLGCVHASRAVVVCIATLVGRGRHDPDWHSQLVGCVQKRLVLTNAFRPSTAPSLPPAWSSICDAPTATDRDSGGRSLQ